MKEEITDSELAEFCQWYKEHYGKTESNESAFITCLCGHFHTYPKEATTIIGRLMKLGLMEKRKSMIYLK